MSEHYTDHRRWSYISKAWIFRTSWNDQEEIAFLSAERDRLKADFTELREEKMIDNAAWESTCNRLKAELAQARAELADTKKRLELCLKAMEA